MVIPKKTQRLTNPQFRYGLLRTLRTPITKKTLINKEFCINSEKTWLNQKCKLCGLKINNRGFHFLNYNIHQNDSIRRHNKCRDILYKYIIKVGWHASKEKSFNLDNKNLKPADIFIVDNTHGKSNIAIDIGIPSSFTEILKLPKNKIVSKLRINKMKKIKKLKYKRIIQSYNINFKACLIESFGHISDNFYKLIKTLALDIAQLFKKDFSTTFTNIK